MIEGFSSISKYESYKALLIRQVIGLPLRNLNITLCGECIRCDLLSVKIALTDNKIISRHRRLLIVHKNLDFDLWRAH